jgi:hypothetical protein
MCEMKPSLGERKAAGIPIDQHQVHSLFFAGPLVLSEATTADHRTGVARLVQYAG